MDSKKSKPSVTGIKDWIRAQSKSIKNGFKNKYNSSIQEINEGISEDATQLEKTGRVFSWLGKKIKDASVNTYEEVKDINVPATKEELTIEGLEKIIGSDLAIKTIGRRRARECKHLYEVLNSYEIESSAKEGVLSDVASNAITDLENLFIFYRSEKLRKDPVLAKQRMDGIYNCIKAIQKKEINQELYDGIKNSVIDDSIKDIVLPDIKDQEFTSLDEVKEFYLLHKDELDGKKKNDITVALYNYGKSLDEGE